MFCQKSAPNIDRSSSSYDYNLAESHRITHVFNASFKVREGFVHQTGKIFGFKICEMKMTPYSSFGLYDFDRNVGAYFVTRRFIGFKADWVGKYAILANEE